MKLKIRYDEAYQVLDLDEKATEQLWVSLDLDGGEALSQEEREKRIQEAFDAKYNRPEYNSWRKLNRHRGESKAKPGKDETEDDVSSFKSWQAKRFKSLMKVRPHVKRIVGLTGTPSSNGLMDLWAQFRLLDLGKRLGRYITHSDM